jgi:Tfp pilus assembly protein PilN
MAIAAGAGAALVLLGFVFVLQTGRLASATHQLAQQQSANAVLQTRINRLQRYRELAQKVADEQALVAEITQGQVMWSGVLRDVSMVIPTDVFLTQMSASVQPVDTTAPATSAAPDTKIVGTISFSGSALDQPTLALWLDRLEKVDGWANPWVSTDTKGSAVVDFTGTVDLTQAATADPRQA